MNNETMQAVRHLREGQLVSFPTETVYALAVRADNESALAGIYRLKGRDFNKPLALMAPDIQSLAGIIRPNDAFIKLAGKFCPGPVTFILQKAENCPLPAFFNPGHNTIAVRIPNNETALEILRSASFPIAATSVNPSGYKEAVTAKQVLDYFPHGIACIIDGGKSPLAAASTIIDLTQAEYKILREGAITAKMTDEALGL